MSICQDPYDELTDGEKQSLTNLFNKWELERRARNWPVADALRSELTAHGCMSPDYKTWHPVFESPQSRFARLEARNAT
jgi:cysteinyl-tRNA synthetase